MLPELPRLTPPEWMSQRSVAQLAATAHKWFSRVAQWAAFPLRQLDPMTCTEPVLDLIAWQRDIQRFETEPLALYRLRVRHAYANARDAGSVDGFKRIFQRLGIGYVEIEERMDGLDWDVINIRLSSNQLDGNTELLDTLIQHYGRTCRRYGWTVIENINVELQMADLANDIETESITWKE